GGGVGPQLLPSAPSERLSPSVSLTFGFVVRRAVRFIALAKAKKSIVSAVATPDCSRYTVALRFVDALSLSPMFLFPLAASPRNQARSNGVSVNFAGYVHVPVAPGT